MGAIETKDYESREVVRLLDDCQKQIDGTDNLAARIMFCLQNLIAIAKILSQEAEQNAKKVDSLWMRLRKLENLPENIGRTTL